GPVMVSSWFGRTLEDRTARQSFQLLQGTGPVFAQQARQSAIGEQAAAGLAARAVVGLVGRVADALDFGATVGTGLSVAAVHGHAFAECGYFFGEITGGLGAQPIDPVRKRGLDRTVQ